MYLLKPFRYSQQLLKYLYSHSTMYLLKRISITSAYRNKVLFTFHHVSIKTLVAKHYCKVIISFTFHHVSIKTKTYACCCVFNKSFTFHHVSIKTYKTAKADYEKKYSHSTMYLLKLRRSSAALSLNTYSHSTMYLLKLIFCAGLMIVFVIHIPPCIY